MSDDCDPYDEKCGGPGGPCRNHGGVVPLPPQQDTSWEAGYRAGYRDGTTAALRGEA